jgi:AraC-like DNA-binding protein
VSLDELRSLISRHARPDMTTGIDDVLVSEVDGPCVPSASMTGTIFALIAQGAKRLSLGQRVYEYGAGQYLVASVDMPIIGHFTEAPSLGFGLVLRPATVAELLLQAGPGVLPRESGAVSGVAVSDAPAELVDAVVRLLRLLDRPGDRAVLAPMVIREILWRLITGEQGAVVRQLGLADSNLALVARAVGWIRDHYREPFQVADLARLSGMSVSAFHRNFQAVTAMSPIQFQKRIRLQEARLLVASGADEVAEIGYRVGYESPSQFSREYRRLFGAPPSQDAVLLAAGAPTLP